MAKRRPLTISPDGTELLEVQFSSGDLVDGPFGAQSNISCIGDGTTTGFLTDGSPLSMDDWQGLRDLYSNPRTNYFPVSEWLVGNLSLHAGSPDVTNSSMVVPGYTTVNAVAFGANPTAYQYALESFAASAGQSYTISALVKLSTGAQPVVGLNASGDLSFIIGGARVESGTIAYQEIGAGVWRVSITGCIAPTTTNNYIGVVRYVGTNGKAFTVSAMQLELGPLTPYIKTSGAAVTVTDYTVVDNVVTMAVPPRQGASLYGLYTQILAIPKIASFATSSAIPFITSTRTDLGNTVTFVHTSSGLVTFSGTFAAVRFNGSGAGLTNVPPGALLAGGVDGQVLMKSGTTWTWGTPGLLWSSPLTGYILGTDGSALTAADQLLQAFQKLQVQSNAKDVAGAAKVIVTASALPFLTSTRSDLANSVTFTHTSSGLITCSGTLAAVQFNGSGAGLTNIPPAALLADGVDGQVLVKSGAAWAWSSAAGTPAVPGRTDDLEANAANSGKLWQRTDANTTTLKIIGKHFIPGIQSIADLEVLVVAGGGGAYGNRAGGAGGGGVRHVTGLEITGSITVTVGLGGTAGTPNGQTNGQNSVFGSIVSQGGGATSADGGCGGGAISGSAAPGHGTSGEGYDGGNGGTPDGRYGSGGGGGGAAHFGFAGTFGGWGGNGGDGYACSISGTLKYYGGGGGGGKDDQGGYVGYGGLGGGGNGGYGGIPGTAGVPNTGGGGGGGGGFYGQSSSSGGHGGSGVVIVRYPTANGTASGGVITYAGLYTIHTFNSSGTFTVLTGALLALYTVDTILPQAAGPLRYSQTIGDGVATTIVVTHNLGTLDLIASIYEVAGLKRKVDDAVEIQNTSATTTTLIFNTAPALNSLRITLLG